MLVLEQPVYDVQQAQQAGLDARLFLQFAQSGVGQSFAELQVTAWHAPLASARGAGPAHQQYLLAAQAYDAHAHARPTL